MTRKKAVEKTAESTLAHAIRKCVDGGKVEFGAKVGVKAALSGRLSWWCLQATAPRK